MFNNTPARKQIGYWVNILKTQCKELFMLLEYFVYLLNKETQHIFINAYVGSGNISFTKNTTNNNKQTPNQIRKQVLTGAN